MLAILNKRATGKDVTAADWQKLLASEPYVRLKKREASMHRDFTDEDFKAFVQSGGLAKASDHPAAYARRVEEDRSGGYRQPHPALPSAGRKCEV